MLLFNSSSLAATGNTALKALKNSYQRDKVLNHSALK